MTQKQANSKAIAQVMAGLPTASPEAAPEVPYAK
jgi:hypothetical protein